jgi:zinc protease
LTVILNERPELPVVAANLVVRTGSDANPIDRPGLANFTGAMLDEGTKSRSATQIADELAQLGASLITTSSMDATVVAVRSLRGRFPQALELLADIVLRPSFPPEEVTRQRASRLAALVQQLDNPGLVASRTASAALYGRRHPYGFAEIGTEEGIRAVTREELVAFWRRNFVPNNAALVVAGDMSEAELSALAEKAFEAWDGGVPSAPPLEAPVSTTSRVVLVDKPGAPQTQLRVATLGAARNTSEYEVLQVLNAGLGGMFSSRINMNLREKNGYTYGAGSSFVYRRTPGPFFVATGVRTDVTAAAVKEILNEIRGVREAPLAPEELRLALGTLVRSLPGEFETSANAGATFSSLYIYDLPLDYYQTFSERAEAVSAEAVLAAGRRYLNPERMIVVVVGDRARIEPGLRSLELGPLELRDARGELKG